MSLFSYKSGHSVRYRTSLLFYFFNKSITYVFGTGFALWRVVIEVSVSASGKVVPAFEEIINSPINSRIVEIYKKGGDSVDVGRPILKLDLLSA